jgi:hypothetical protein
VNRRRPKTMVQGDAQSDWECQTVMRTQDWGLSVKRIIAG